MIARRIQYTSASPFGPCRDLKTFSMRIFGRDIIWFSNQTNTSVPICIDWRFLRHLSWEIHQVGGGGGGGVVGGGNYCMLDRYGGLTEPRPSKIIITSSHFAIQFICYIFENITPPVQDAK